MTKDMSNIKWTVRESTERGYCGLDSSGDEYKYLTSDYRILIGNNDWYPGFSKHGIKYLYFKTMDEAKKAIEEYNAMTEVPNTKCSGMNN